MATNDSDFFEGSSPEAVPDGTYDAVLASADISETKFGARRRWVFQLPSEDEFQVSQFTSLTFAGNSRGNEIVAALIGHKLAPKEQVARESLIGRRCRLVVSSNDKGWNVISAFLQDGARRVAPQPAAATPDDMSWLD